MASALVIRILRPHEIALCNIAGVSQSMCLSSNFSVDLNVLEVVVRVKTYKNIFIKNSDYHSHCIINKDNLWTPIHTLKTFDMSPLYVGIKFKMLNGLERKLKIYYCQLYSIPWMNSLSLLCSRLVWKPVWDLLNNFHLLTLLKI